MEWRLADAKNRFSELVNLALADGPQRVRRRDQVVVVMAQAEYERLTGKRPPLKDYLRSGPGLDGINLGREQSPMRDAKL